MCKPVLNFLCPFPFLVLFCHCEGVKRLKQSPLIFFIVLVLFCHCALLLFFSVLAQSFPWQSQKATASQRRLAVTKRGGVSLRNPFLDKVKRRDCFVKTARSDILFFLSFWAKRRISLFRGRFFAKTAQDDTGGRRLRMTGGKVSSGRQKEE